MASNGWDAVRLDWGHGSYVAPDWSADYLHREAVFILNSWSRGEFGGDYNSVSSEQQAVLHQRLQNVVRKNNYDEATGKLTIEPVRAQAFEDNLKHYSAIFSNGDKNYAVQRNAQADPAKLRQLNSFFFWTSWASATNRPNNTISYTSNFPSEPLVGNVPTSSAIVWTGVSVINPVLPARDEARARLEGETDLVYFLSNQYRADVGDPA